MGLGLELIEVACFFFKLTAGQLLVFELDVRLKSRYYSGGEGGSTRKAATLWCKFTPGEALLINFSYVSL